MAYVSKEMKSKLAPAIKAICRRYGVKASLSVRNHSTLVLTIQSSGIDFIGNFNSVHGQLAERRNLQFRPAEDHIYVNVYWCQEHFGGVAREFLLEVIEAMRGPDYFDESDAQTDYFHCSHYIDINIGRWDKTYRYDPADGLISA